MKKHICDDCKWCERVEETGICINRKSTFMFTVVCGRLACNKFERKSFANRFYRYCKNNKQKKTI